MAVNQATARRVRQISVALAKLAKSNKEIENDLYALVSSTEESAYFLDIIARKIGVFGPPIINGFTLPDNLDFRRSNAEDEDRDG
jgi:hypothetical protein